MKPRNQNKLRDEEELKCDKWLKHHFDDSLIWPQKKRDNKKQIPMFYAIAKGHHQGIYTNWHKEAKKQIKGCPMPKFKGFKTRKEAEAYINQHNDASDAML